MARAPLLLLISSVLIAGCGRQASPTTPEASKSSGPSTVLLSVTSDATTDTQSVDMAMKLAGFSMEEGRKVVMFFNVKGVKFPTKEFDAEFAFQDGTPLKEQLAELIDDGVDVHVCPICMKALGVEGDNLMDGAKVTTRASLFANIGADTSVFTY